MESKAFFFGALVFFSGFSGDGKLQYFTRGQIWIVSALARLQICQLPCTAKVLQKQIRMESSFIFAVGTVDGRNPANQLICKLSRYIQGFVLVRWFSRRISSTVRHPQNHVEQTAKWLTLDTPLTSLFAKKTG